MPPFDAHLALLEDQAARRHLDPEHPEADPFAVALSGPGWGRRQQHPLGPIGEAWIEARGRFIDREVRRATMPENAQVVLVSPGLDPALCRMPGGLIRPRTVHLLERPEVLDARRRRLQQAGLREPGVLTAAVEPGDWSTVLEALRQLPLRAGSALSVVFASGLPEDGLEQLLDALDAIAALPHEWLSVTLCWLGQELSTLPEPAQRALTTLAPQLPLHPLGLDLACRPLGIGALDHSLLLRAGAVEIGFGTHIDWSRA